MKCSGCGAENPDTSRFCGACGSALEAACPSCGAPNPPANSFCGACGARLRAGAEAPAPPATREPAPTIAAGERRQVTVLFADLSGFTELSRELDAEELHGLVGRVFDAIDAIIVDYGGTIDKHIGDAVMALFGAPIAHGDDPLRSCRAAFDVHRAMDALSAAEGRNLRVHIGIASGEVVAGGLGGDRHQEYTVVGESVNLASRLDELADAGQTLISNAVYRSVSGSVDCDPMGEVTVKGLAEPVKVWRMRALRGGAARRASGAFIGRDAELRQFTGIVESCRATGKGQAVLVRGEAGIGKSRLVEEFSAIAEARGFAGHKGLVLDFGVGKGQDAVRSLVRSLLRIAPGGDKEVRQAAADAALSQKILSPDRRAFLDDLLDVPQSTEVRAIYDAMDNATRNQGKREVVAELIEGASAQGPIMVTLEDIHWATPLTIAHLATMTSTVADCPAVLVMTSRIEGDPLDQAWRASTRGTPLATIDLGPLRADEAVALASTFIDATNRYAVRCIERAEGNPLFLEQLLRDAEDSADEDIPASIQSLVMARADRLPPADKQALQAASVIGQRFTLDALRHLVGDAAYTCQGLMEHVLVRPDGEDYLFAHALIRDGVYSSLLNARKRELHRLAAAWFADQDPVLRAEHLDRAEDDAAPRAYLDAARAQAELFRFEPALRLVERGIELAGDAPDRTDLMALRGELLLDLGSVGPSIDAYREALEVAQDDVARCRARIGLAAGMRVLDQYDDALDALDRAESAAASHELKPELAQIHHLRGNLYFPLGRIDDCREQHELALAYAREAKSPRSEAQALSGLGDAEYGRGRMISAHDYFRRCVALCREHGFGAVEVANLYMLAFTREYFNEIQGALDDGLAAVAAAKKVGHHRAELLARIIVFNARYELGETSRAREEIDRVLRLVERLGARRFEPQGLLYLAKMSRAEGRHAEALEMLERALAISRETGISFYGPRLLGDLALTTNDSDTRRKALEEGESILRSGAVSHCHLWFFRDAMEVALQTGDYDEVDRYAAALEDYARAEPLPWTEFFVARGRALAAYHRGTRDDATMNELRRLRDEAASAGLMTAIAALDEPLSVAAQ